MARASDDWWKDVIVAPLPSAPLPAGPPRICDGLQSALVRQTNCWSGGPIGRDEPQSGYRRHGRHKAHHWHGPHSPEAFCYIEDALESVQCGGTVVVEKGAYEYDANLVITRPVTIKAADTADIRKMLPFSRSLGSDSESPLESMNKSHFPVLYPTDGSRSCIDVRLGREATEGVKIIGLAIKAPQHLTRPCIDVQSPTFVLKNNWIIGDHNEDAVLVRSGLAAISGNEITGADVGVRLTGRHEAVTEAEFIADGGDRYYSPQGEPGASREGRPDADPDPQYARGMHLVLDNHLAENNIGLQVTGETSVYAARNVIVSNRTAGIQNMNGGGAYTANYIADNGNGIAFVFDTRANDGVWKPVKSDKPRRQADWPVRAPMIIGNAIKDNASAGVLVVAPVENDPDGGYFKRVAEALYNTMGTVWGNCISGNFGYAIDLIGVRQYRVRSVLDRSSDDHPPFPPNNTSDNKEPWWGGTILEHITLGYYQHKDNCRWFPKPDYVGVRKLDP
jgi:hypothetical protein